MISMLRTLSFEGILNSRDLGGLVTADGNTIRKGLLLRTANLAQASDADLLRLQEEVRLSLVLDLRTASERTGSPDRLPAGAEYLSLPVFDEATAGITREDGTPTPFAVPDMAALYRTMIAAEPCREALHDILTAVFTHDYGQGAVLWHCTAGKDRCGIVSSLVLAALHVSRDEIRKDYAVNPDEFLVQADTFYRKALRAGQSEVRAAVVRDVFLALPRYMEFAFQAIDEEYGDSESYLHRGLCIPEEVLCGFRRQVLV